VIQLSLILLAVSCVVVLYTYAGYPLTLRLISRVVGTSAASPPDLSDADCPPVVILVVAHNEAPRIERKIEICLGQDYPPEKLRVLIVSDGSTDETVEAVRNYPSDRVSLIDSQERSGKAAGINLAMSQIDEDFVVLADTRQRLSPSAVRNLVEHFADDSVGAVSGELRIEVEDESWLSHGVSWYWNFEIRLRQLESAVHSVVGVSGALYALRRAAFTPIPERTILDDVLIPMNVVMSGYRVKFEARAHAIDGPVTDLARERTRKVRTLAGNFQLVALRPQLLNPARNPIFVQFVSHKLMRLLVPLAMLAALLSCAVLTSYHWLFAVLLAGQLAGCALAVLPEKTSGPFSIGPIRAVRTFVTMHWFVVLGFKEFLTNRNAYLWDVSSTAKAPSLPVEGHSSQPTEVVTSD
jgi:biofilm PGA synthesis N-glycosyltransferase PgaC